MVKDSNDDTLKVAVTSPKTLKIDVAGLAPLVIALATLITAIATSIVTVYTAVKVEQVRHETNSMKDELVAATRKGALAEGAKIQREKDIETQRKE